jgi:metacaspase-1
MAEGMSIHIGLNRVDPDHYGGWDGELRACEADARDMALLSEQRGFEGRLLLTEDATSANVTAALREAADTLDRGDMLFLSYSGHGGQVPDTNGDEPDTERLDETWVLYDRQLVDDEAYALYGSFKSGVRILVLSDSCHSGTVHRLLPNFLQPAVLEERFGSTDPEVIAKRSRAMPAEVGQVVYRQHKEQYDDVQASVKANDQTEISASLVLVSGCQDNQLSADGERNGLFTAKLLDVWNHGKFKGYYRGLHKAIVARMPFDQTPNLVATGPGGRAFLRQRPFTI